MKIISLFSGAGGLDLGLIQAGNKVIWANDIDKNAVETYKHNIGDHIILDDITTTGSSMQACNELLLNSGVKSENIFNIALGATVRDDDEEI